MKRLCEMLEISPGITAIVGGGGKTTLMMTLAKELSAKGTVIVTTSTKIFPPTECPVLVEPTCEEVTEALSCHQVICVGAKSSEKLTAPSLGFPQLSRLADYVLTEADGSRQLPLKAHADYEPVIPNTVNQCIYVIGIDCIGSRLAEVCHRPELFAALNGCTVESIVTAELAAEAVERERLAHRYFINKADDNEGMKKAANLAALLDKPSVIGSLHKGEYKCL
ncbi:MAG: selenium cofactor biosynthesis protein YqeC [Selenomonadaceae bacterium]|nr:selenium cofactor biosynthesis protein YqeC [Selenomonadaceae bacterium]